MSRNHYMSHNYSYDRIYAGGSAGLAVSVNRNGEGPARFDFSTIHQSLAISLSKDDTKALARLLVEVLEDWQ